MWTHTHTHTPGEGGAEVTMDESERTIGNERMESETQNMLNGIIRPPIKQIK